MDLKIQLDPDLALRFEGLPRELALAMGRFLGHFVVEPRPSGRAHEELSIRVGPPGTGDLTVLTPASRDSPLEVAQGAGLLRLRTGSIAAWHEAGRDRAGIEVANPTRREIRDFVSYALAPFLFAVALGRGRFGLHAAAIAVEGQGILLPGPSASGKTTLYRQARERGLDLLSDDLVWVKRSEEGFFLEPFPRGWPARRVPGPTLARAPLSAIVFPAIGSGPEGRYRSIHPPEAVPELVSQAALFGDYGTVGTAFALCCAMAESARAFRLLAGENRDGLDLLLQGVAPAYSAKTG